MLDIFDDEDVLEANRVKAEGFTRQMRPLAERPEIRHFRQRGMIWAFDVDTARSDFALAYFSAMLNRGCLLRPIGKSVYFMPPYTLKSEEMDWLASASVDALDEVLAGESVGGDPTALP